MNLLKHVTPDSSAVMALLLVLASATVAPQLVYRASDDGGFEQAGQKINLGRWTHISAHQNNDAVPGINRPDASPASHYESWINAGQWLRFDRVPATQRSRFVAEVRVHPAWPRDNPIPVTFKVHARTKGKPLLEAQVIPSIETQTEWSRIELDLSPLAGSKVKIQLSPSADQQVWTLMRDPRIELIDVPASP